MAAELLHVAGVRVIGFLLVQVALGGLIAGCFLMPAGVPSRFIGPVQPGFLPRYPHIANGSHNILSVRQLGREDNCQKLIGLFLTRRVNLSNLE